MADIVNKETRSRMMRGIRGRDTKPELLIRRGLYSRGYRFRLCDKSLPGRPDIVIKNRKVAILTHGCFWHGHKACSYFRVPANNRTFWANKIGANQVRDAKSLQRLSEAGWRCAIVWECALRHDPNAAINELCLFIESSSSSVEIAWAASGDDQAAQIVSKIL